MPEGILHPLFHSKLAYDPPEPTYIILFENVRKYPYIHSRIPEDARSVDMAILLIRLVHGIPQECYSVLASGLPSPEPNPIPVVLLDSRER